MRVAIAGFQHETNSFGYGVADLQAFMMADSWPGMLEGTEVITGTEGLNVPIAGFIAASASCHDIELVPILWCAAEPSGPVTDHAFDTISSMIIEGIRSTGNIDAVYLDLHGAMITDSYTDGEGELLRRVRNELSVDVPVVISLDMHANLSRTMVDLCNGMCIYRTYPHLDMAATGARCLTLMRGVMAGKAVFSAFRQSPYLLPLHAQHTDAAPMKSLYATLAQLEQVAGVHADLALGFTAGDFEDTGPSVVVYADTHDKANNVAESIIQKLCDIETSIDVTLMSPDQAIEAALNRGEKSGKPIVFADVQDNPGAGASSDTTAILRALVTRYTGNVLLGLMYDPALASQAHVAGVGRTLTGSLGGNGQLEAVNSAYRFADAPFNGSFTVERIDEGNCEYTGEMYGGGICTLGKSAVLRIDGSDLHVVVTSIRNQCLDLAHFTHFGLEPEKADIVVVKSTVHFRAAFEPIAQEVLNVAAPGLNPCVLNEIPYARLRAGVRVGPEGLPHQPDASG